jgi:hypothetical protein
LPWKEGAAAGQKVIILTGLVHWDKDDKDFGTLDVEFNSQI